MNRLHIWRHFPFTYCGRKARVTGRPVTVLSSDRRRICLKCLDAFEKGRIADVSR